MWASKCLGYGALGHRHLPRRERITELFVAGPHNKLMALITTPYAKAISSVLQRTLRLLFRSTEELRREVLWKDVGDFLTKQGFVEPTRSAASR